MENNILDAGAAAIAQAAQQSVTLMSLNMSGNDFGEEASNLLKACVSKTLTHILADECSPIAFDTGRKGTEEISLEEALADVDNQNDAVN